MQWRVMGDGSPGTSNRTAAALSLMHRGLIRHIDAASSEKSSDVCARLKRRANVHRARYRPDTSTTHAMELSPAAQPWNSPRPPPFIASSSISSMTRRWAVTALGWPQISEQP